MSVRLDAVGWSSPPVRVTWDRSDVDLYALGIGIETLVEDVPATFAWVIGGPDVSVVHRAGPFDPATMVHGAEHLVVHAPLPPSGSVAVTRSIVGIHDKGSGALVVVRSSCPLFTTTTSAFVRGAGGFGASGGEQPPAVPAPPVGPPDRVLTWTSRPDQALLYRLSGDRNPLHSDPAAARAAGFARPILHGLCTLAAVAHRVDPTATEVAARFTAPLVPGDEVTIRTWPAGPFHATAHTHPLLTQGWVSASR